MTKQQVAEQLADECKELLDELKLKLQMLEVLVRDKDE